MMGKKIALIFFLFWGITAYTSCLFAQDKQQEIRTIIHLLGYVARDYPNAVHNGKVIDEGEYKEQQEFSGQILRLTKAAHIFEDTNALVYKNMNALTQAVNQKENPKKIAELADFIRTKIIAITGVATTPQQWPNTSNGEKLYTINCVQCHGAKGDGNGALAASLEPKPANFHDVELMKQVSPFQTYNTIKLGVEGTSMPAFSQFSDKELWDLAFYIKSIRFGSHLKDSTQLREFFSKSYPKLGLKTIAVSNDIKLLDTLESFGGAAENLVALRLLKPTKEGAGSSLIIARQKLKQALVAFQKGNKKKARTLALNAYLEGIEPVEAQLRNADGSFVPKLEKKMFAVRQLIEQGATAQELSTAIDDALNIVQQADDLLQSQHYDFWLAFLIAAGIVLREGLEAFLVIAVILALIHSSGVRKALPWLHGGWITAVILGFAGWFLSGYILDFGGKNREIMEGLVSLLAVIILLFVGFWLHENTQAKKWQVFINERIGGYLQKDKMFGLAAFSFMVVFREAFEVILFLQAINLEQAKGSSAIGLGVLAAAIAIAILAYIFLKYTKRIPVLQLFRYSSWIIVLLAIVLIGKGVHSLQESGWMTMHSFNFSPIEWLGIYPTTESIVAQCILIGIIAISYLRKQA